MLRRGVLNGWTTVRDPPTKDLRNWSGSTSTDAASAVFWGSPALPYLASPLVHGIATKADFSWLRFALWLAVAEPPSYSRSSVQLLKNMLYKAHNYVKCHERSTVCAENYTAGSLPLLPEEGSGEEGENPRRGFFVTESSPFLNQEGRRAARRRRDVASGVVNSSSAPR